MIWFLYGSHAPEYLDIKEVKQQCTYSQMGDISPDRVTKFEENAIVSAEWVKKHKKLLKQKPGRILRPLLDIYVQIQRAPDSIQIGLNNR